MPRKKSTNPAAILSVSLPLTTRSKIDKFNPRNRSQFFNEAVLQYINRNDREAIQNRMDLEENIDFEDPRISKATPQQLMRTLVNSDILSEDPNSYNPALLNTLRNQLLELTKEINRSRVE